MRADDAADAIAELPQNRRQPVIDLLPPGVRTKVLTLMGFNPTSAGGLMGVEYLAVPSGTPVAATLTAVGAASTLQPEALASVHAVDGDNRLRGVARLVTLLQADPAASLIDVCDADTGPGRGQHQRRRRRRADDRLQPDHHPGGRRPPPHAGPDHRR